LHELNIFDRTVALRSFNVPTLTQPTISYIHLIIRSLSKTSLIGMVDVFNANVAILLVARGHDIGLNDLEINVGNLGAIAVKDLGNLLESRTTGFYVEDRDEDEFDEDPALSGVSLMIHVKGRQRLTYSVYGVELPPGVQVRESERVDVLVDGQGNLDEEVHDHQTLGTNLERQDLDSVGDEQTRPCERVTHREDPDHGDDTFSSGIAAVGLLLRRANCPDDEAQAHSTGGDDEERATTNAINEQRARHGNNEGQDGKTTVESELGVGIGDANVVVDIGGVVGNETVARPLREQTERRKEHKPVSVALSLEEVEVRRVLLVLELEAKGLLDLGVLELNSCVVHVTVGVVRSKHLESLLVPLLTDQPTWRLGDKVYEGQLDDGGKSLSECGNAPAPVTVDALGAESQPGADDGTNVPQAVVDTSDTRTMLRVADLGEEQRRRQLGKRVTKTHQETTTHEVSKVLSSSLDGSTDNHDKASDDNSRFAAKAIGNERSNRKGCNRANGVEGSQKTKRGLLGVAEVILPVLENTEVVQHGSIFVS
jgi:hypothetical protein